MQTAVFIATSLDGYIARPDGALDWLLRSEYSPEGEDFGYADFIASVSCVVMGRQTFEQVLSFDDWFYHGKRLVVISRSKAAVPDGFALGAESFVGSLNDLIQQLQDQGETRLYIDGGQLIQSCLSADLIDEMIITRVPVLLGAGRPLFGTLPADLKFQHQHTQAYANGLVQSHYRRR